MRKLRMADHKRKARIITAGIFLAGMVVYALLQGSDRLSHDHPFIALSLGFAFSALFCSFLGYPIILDSLIKPLASGSWFDRNGEIVYITDMVDIWSDGSDSAEVMGQSELNMSALPQDHLPLVWMNNNWRPIATAMISLQKEAPGVYPLN